MPISTRYKTIFVHIPKTGGTSIEDMLDIRYDRANPANNLFNVRPTIDAPAYQHYLPTEIEAATDGASKDTFFRFTIVREPWDRFQSAYAFIQRRNLPVRRATALDQLVFAEDVVRRKAYHEPHHEFFIPQIAFVDDLPDYFDALYRFDAFDDAVRDIQRRVKCKKAARRLNARPAGDVPDDKNARLVFERVYADDIRAWNDRWKLLCCDHGT